MPIDDVLVDLLIGLAGLLAAGFVFLHFRKRNIALHDEIDRLRRQIRESDQQYDALVDDAPIASMLWESDFTIKAWSRQAALTFGYTRDEIVGRNLLTSLVHPDSRKRFADTAGSILRGGIATPDTFPSLTRDGNVLDCVWHHTLHTNHETGQHRVLSMCSNTSEIKRLENESALFQRLIEVSDDPVVVVDHLDGGRIRYVNPGACNYFGRNASELMAMRIEEGCLPIDTDTLSQCWWGVAPGKTFRVETEYRSQDGRVAAIEMAANRVDHEHGSFIALQFRDVTARRTAEEHLRKSEIAEAVKEQERRYRQVFENSSDVLFTLDKTGGWHFQELNDEASKAFGVRSQTLSGMYFADILNGKIGQEAAAALTQHLPYWMQCVSEGLPCEYDGELSLRASNQPMQDSAYHIRLMPLADDFGISRIICVGYDITQRRAFEKQMIASEMQFRTLATNTPDNIARWDTKGRYLYINPTTERTIGRETREIIGTYIPDSYSQIKAGIAQVVATGQPVRVRQSSPVNGVIERHEVSLVPEFDASGNVASVLGLGRNMTEFYRLHDAIRELVNRKDEAIEEERRRIARDLHEDLGQLLSALRMNISMLPMQFGQELAGLASRGQSMIDLVDQTIQAMRATVAALRPTPLNEGLVPGIEWLVARFIGQFDLDIQLSLPPDDIDMDDPHATALFRIAQEALTNVARHAHAGTANISLSRRDSEWEMTIEDNGSGFDPSTVQGRNYGLLGMSERALAIGGQLYLDSILGKGTLVRVAFPAPPKGRESRLDQEQRTGALH